MAGVPWKRISGIKHNKHVFGVLQIHIWGINFSTNVFGTSHIRIPGAEYIYHIVTHISDHNSQTVIGYSNGVSQKWDTPIMYLPQISIYHLKVVSIILVGT